jgi:hypothetical protein
MKSDYGRLPQFLSFFLIYVGIMNIIVVFTADWFVFIIGENGVRLSPFVVVQKTGDVITSYSITSYPETSQSKIFFTLMACVGVIACIPIVFAIIPNNIVEALFKISKWFICLFLNILGLLLYWIVMYFGLSNAGNGSVPFFDFMYEELSTMNIVLVIFLPFLYPSTGFLLYLFNTLLISGMYAVKRGLDI